ncbi:hypothetical protein ACH5RR_005558 [Cinchona calisaya]|uniref:Mitochondrial import inner membrane translocase subunit TIM50 n=1 Tax=Cinchona calisaya TaxID=153742 RepID=A0ABD3ALH2_9GENT
MARKIQEMKLKNVVLDDSSDDESDTAEAAADYLGGLSLEKLNLGPKKKLLVLCLGGLLVDRVHKRNSASIKGRRPDFVFGNFLVFKRPFCAEFLKFCFERFEVGLWSSAKEHNIDYVLDCIASGIRSKFVFIWDQEECIDTGFGSLDNKHKPIFLKELKKIWENRARALPFYSSSNTLLIDTDPCKALLNPPNTAIFPPQYEWNNSEDAFLGPKGDLQVFLDGLADADEVPSYVKEHSIGQPAITSTHPDWSFYNQVLRHLYRTKA